MTGRGLGLCSGARTALGEVGAGASGMGRQGGRGKGWRHRHWFHETGLPGWQRGGLRGGRRWSEVDTDVPAAPSEAQELMDLQQQAAELERALGALRQRMQQLGAEAGQDQAPP